MAAQRRSTFACLARSVRNAHSRRQYSRTPPPHVVGPRRREETLAARAKCALHGGREFLVHLLELLGRIGAGHRRSGRRSKALTISAVLNCCARFEPPRPLRRAQACHAFLTSPVAGATLTVPRNCLRLIPDTWAIQIASCRLRSGSWSLRTTCGEERA